MKKAKLFLIAAIVAVVVFSATGVFAKTVMEFNGYDWIMLSETEKIYFAYGYLVAVETQRDNFADLYSTGTISNVEYEFFDDSFYFAGTVQNLVDKINKYYKDTALFEHTVWAVIIVEYGKVWW